MQKIDEIKNIPYFLPVVYNGVGSIGQYMASVNRNSVRPKITPENRDGLQLAIVSQL